MLKLRQGEGIRSGFREEREARGDGEPPRYGFRYDDTDSRGAWREPAERGDRHELVGAEERRQCGQRRGGKADRPQHAGWPRRAERGNPKALGGVGSNLDPEAGTEGRPARPASR